MSIVTANLSKHFGKHRAVDQLSFSVAPGEIVGLLGPNGAGKSTTIRMLAGYLQPSAGKIHICGHDIQSEPRQAKAHIGYLPEHNPLYRDMYVWEYLHFIGRIHGLRRQERLHRIATVIAQCGMTPVQSEQLGMLSKGYRQRVGLAAALVHNPSVLILDEPTVGLDPNQLQEIRAFIRSLRQEKAVIFSTHIMQEVEALCDRVIILHQGQLRMAGRLAELATGYGGRSLAAIFQEVTGGGAYILP